jgi:hypothetical protein
MSGVRKTTRIAAETGKAWEQACHRLAATISWVRRLAQPHTLAIWNVASVPLARRSIFSLHKPLRHVAQDRFRSGRM